MSGEAERGEIYLSVSSFSASFALEMAETLQRRQIRSAQIRSDAISFVSYRIVSFRFVPFRLVWFHFDENSAKQKQTAASVSIFTAVLNDFRIAVGARTSACPPRSGQSS